jgi:hypothetical protein
MSTTRPAILRCPCAARRTIVGFVLLLLAGVAVPGVSHAAVPSQADDAAAQQLAERYLPVLWFQEQPEECSRDGEPYRPMDVELLLGNPEIALRQVGRGDPVVTWAPTAADIHGLGEGFYLDFPGVSLDPGCVFERDERRFTGDGPVTVYAHVATQDDHPDRLVLQYWFFWYFNDWNNNHEGDWEGIQIVFPASTVGEALQVDPLEVGYAQHELGERASWTADELTREGDRPFVYPSAGSHASYFGTDLYLGRNGSEGFGCDDTSGEVVRADPAVVVLPDAVDDPDTPLAWLAFDGRWGERGEGPFNGPTGPTDKERWDRPIDWQEQLRSSSVVVPGGSTSAGVLAEAFCRTVEFGSNQLMTFKLSPGRAVVTLTAVGLVIFLLARRTSWAPVPPLPLVHPRRAGEAVRASFSAFRRAPGVFAGVGLAALPLGLTAGLLAAGIRHVPFVGDVAALSFDTGSGSGLVASLFVAGLANLIVTVALASATVWILDQLSNGTTPTTRAAIVAVFDRTRALAGGLARAVLVVGLLLVSIVGAPFGVHRLVRYQFMAHAATLERCDGSDALRRSSSLVKGRWWSTAFVVALVNVAVVVIVTGLGLLLLIVVRPPFWLLSALIGAAEVVVAPIASIIVAYLYGNAVWHDRTPAPGTDVAPEPQPATSAIA